MGESAEDLLPADPVVGEVDRFGWPGAGLGWGELSEGTVRPGGGVVVLQVLGQRPGGRPHVEPTAGMPRVCLAADTATVPLITARRPTFWTAVGSATLPKETRSE